MKKETIEEFIARGGQIQRVPMYTTSGQDLRFTTEIIRDQRQLDEDHEVFGEPQRMDPAWERLDEVADRQERFEALKAQAIAEGRW